MHNHKPFSFNYGDYANSASTTQEALLLIKHFQQTENNRKKLSQLRKNQHGHRFNYNRQCSCGLYQSDYYATQQRDYHAPQCPAQTPDPTKRKNPEGECR